MKRLKSQMRRDRWFHYFRWPNGKETPLIHGVEPDDPQLVAAWAACNAECERTAKPEDAPRRGSLKMGFLAYMESEAFSEFADVTRKNRAAVYKRLIRSQGDRPLSTISPTDIQAGLASKSAAGALADFKALRPAFAWIKANGLIGADPMARVTRPKVRKTDGYEPWTADDIERFRARWPVGTTERLAFDLALYTGQRRADLVGIGWQHLRRVDGREVLSIRQSKTGATAYVPMSPELRAALAGTDGRMIFLLTSFGKPFTAAGFGNFFRAAADAAGVERSLHGLRKAFCIYWAERGLNVNQIAAMSGHSRAAELEPYTRAADRLRMASAIAGMPNL